MDAWYFRWNNRFGFSDYSPEKTVNITTPTEYQFRIIP
jgi:hypothetical protein